MSIPGSHERLASWAAGSIGADAEVSAIRPLRPNGSPWLLEVIQGGRAKRAVLKAGSAGMRAELATEAAALRLAQAHNLPAPRVIASDLHGGHAGCIAVLMTYLDGSDRVPLTVDRERLRAIGAAAAAIHSIPLAPTHELPLRARPMPWINFTDERLRGRSPTTALLQRGDQLLREVPKPAVDTAFVHGDLWAGNLLWQNSSYLATIDWEAAGAGSYGVDLGSLRLDAALLHGQAAPDEVLAGWESSSGRQARDVAYWDLVAALNTSADMTGATATIHQAGRKDLDGGELTTGRDAFLRAALGQFA